MMNRLSRKFEKMSAKKQGERSAKSLLSILLRKAVEGVIEWFERELKNKGRI